MAEHPIFVIQKHDATTLHYDFRLQVEGVLVSWVIPKGPSTDPAEKRLALRVEDHSMEHAEFEGVIPEGEYGAGTVLVWDKGTYRNLMAEKDPGEKAAMQESISDGHVEVWLRGEKIRGGYALIRTSNGEQEQERWLLVKMDDEEADARRNPVHTEPESVLSGRTLEEIMDQRGKEASS
ncbi:MAG: DNA polymerase ligase N-terminal domain-containing protein [Balneolaceae bacterium]|nr:DNA polymerase ligase N-terminal domain-containing protein [Balneolaceae bacterium]